MMDKPNSKHKRTTVTEFSESGCADKVDSTLISQRPRTIYDQTVENPRITQEEIFEKIYPSENSASNKHEENSDRKYIQVAVMVQCGEFEPTASVKRITKQCISMRASESTTAEVQHTHTDGLNSFRRRDENSLAAELDPRPNYTNYNGPVAKSGPRLTVEGQTVRWIDDVNTENCSPVVISVAFETVNQRIETKHLELHNNGTTVIYYSWTRLQETDQFQSHHYDLRRFYYDIKPNIIKPGEKLKIPITFRSLRGGIFKESWQLQTQPKLNAKSPILLRLSGTAAWAEQYQFISLRRASPVTEIENEAKDRAVQRILDSLLYHLRQPQPIKRPTDLVSTEVETFSKHNPGMHYHYSVIQNIRKIYNELRAILREQTSSVDHLDRQIPEQWNLSLDNARKLVTRTEALRGYATAQSKRNEPFKFLKYVDTLCFPQVQARTDRSMQLYQICYYHLMDSVLHCFEASNKLRTLHGLPTTIGAITHRGKGLDTSEPTALIQVRTSQAIFKATVKFDGVFTATCCDKTEQKADVPEVFNVIPNPGAWRQKVTELLHRQVYGVFTNITTCFSELDYFEARN